MKKIFLIFLFLMVSSTFSRTGGKFVVTTVGICEEGTAAKGTDFLIKGYWSEEVGERRFIVRDVDFGKDAVNRMFVLATTAKLNNLPLWLEVTDDNMHSFVTNLYISSF